MVHAFDDVYRVFVRKIKVFEVKEDLKKVKPGKAMGIDDVPIEVWRCLGVSS